MMAPPGSPPMDMGSTMNTFAMQDNMSEAPSTAIFANKQKQHNGMTMAPPGSPPMDMASTMNTFAMEETRSEAPSMAIFGNNKNNNNRNQIQPPSSPPLDMGTTMNTFVGGGVERREACPSEAPSNAIFPPKRTNALTTSAEMRKEPHIITTNPEDDTQSEAIFSGPTKTPKNLKEKGKQTILPRQDTPQQQSGSPHHHRDHDDTQSLSSSTTTAANNTLKNTSPTTTVNKTVSPKRTREEMVAKAQEKARKNPLLKHRNIWSAQWKERQRNQQLQHQEHLKWKKTLDDTPIPLLHQQQNKYNDTNKNHDYQEEEDHQQQQQQQQANRQQQQLHGSPHHKKPPVLHRRPALDLSSMESGRRGLVEMQEGEARLRISSEFAYANKRKKDLHSNINQQQRITAAGNKKEVQVLSRPVLQPLVQLDNSNKSLSYDAASRQKIKANPTFQNYDIVGTPTNRAYHSGHLSHVQAIPYGTTLPSEKLATMGASPTTISWQDIQENHLGRGLVAGFTAAEYHDTEAAQLISTLSTKYGTNVPPRALQAALTIPPVAPSDKLSAPNGKKAAPSPNLALAAADAPHLYSTNNLNTSKNNSNFTASGSPMVQSGSKSFSLSGAASSKFAPPRPNSMRIAADLPYAPDISLWGDNISESTAGGVKTPTATQLLAVNEQVEREHVKSMEGDQRKQLLKKIIAEVPQNRADVVMHWMHCAGIVESEAKTKLHKKAPKKTFGERLGVHTPRMLSSEDFNLFHNQEMESRSKVRRQERAARAQLIVAMSVPQHPTYAPTFTGMPAPIVV
eukprot:TRINITY_DN62404_c0_g1_i2.p1 TRINITY_DN62404_c0_g1~~TRINITY_DN62404_c0_g1_i2.p1  ORF type:complete len:858 (+),score=98.58 TRINITY_DN62404_c0_g1_i2:195-2576(+)